MSQAQHLYQLQLLDSKISQAMQQIRKIKELLGETEALKQAKNSFADTEQKLHKVQATMRNLDLEVKGLSEKIAKHEKLLYSGKSLSPKEATNLQEEIESVKRWHSTKEELLLEDMVEAEEIEETLEQKRTELATIDTEWNIEQERLTQELVALKKKVISASEQRTTNVQTIDKNSLNDYETTKRKKGGVAVAATKDGVCQECWMRASNNKLQQAKDGNKLVYCGACSRILYVS